MAIGYVPILACAMCIMFARTLLAARVLDVSEFGLFSVGMLLSNTFCMLGCLGFYLLLQRDLPMLIAKRRRVRGAVMLRQTLLLAVSGFACLLPLSFAGFFSVSPMFFVVSLFNGLAQQIFLVVTLQSRSEGQTMRFATENFVRALAVILVISLSSMLSGDAALMLLAEAVITFAISTKIFFVLCRQRRISTVALWVVAARGLTKLSWATPLTLLSTGVVGFIMMNADRWLAAALLGHDQFALYAFAGIVLLLAQSVQSIINVSVFPHLAQSYAITGKIATGRKALRYSMVVLGSSFCLSLPSYWLAGYAIDALFPNYGMSMQFLGWFLLIASLRMADFLTSFLIIAGDEACLLAINVAAVGFSVLVWGALFAFGLAEIRPLTIVWLAVTVAVCNFAGCTLAVVRRGLRVV
jgi:O-antigen/teichoic acid export membrane protein